MAGGRAREFDYWPIDNPLENATIVRENVSVLSIASDWAHRLLADHEQAKLCCQTLDGMPLALGRAVSMCDRVDNSRPVAVLDWGFARTTFCIVLNGRPLFVRCLRDCEYGAVIRVLRDDLGLTWDEARQVAVQHAARVDEQAGDDGDLQRLVTEVTAPVMSQLVSELERTLVYLRMHRQKLLPQHMWLFGGGAVVNGIAPWLRQRANLDVHYWDLGESSFSSPTAGQSPVAMLGPAIALSALAWEVT
jgi:Tfp pilus assembly PilM family ATPase